MLIFIFAIVHSGLASLRDDGEKLIGERVYRVLFAGVSLPLAVSAVVSPLTFSFGFGSHKNSIAHKCCMSHSILWICS